MGFGKAPTSNTKAVGQELAAVLGTHPKPWYTQSHLIKLNFCILSLVMFSSSNGYDGSMMNGLLALPQWQEFMNKPTGAWLGFINAIYSLGSAAFYPLAAWMSNKYGRKMGVWIGYAFLILGTVMQSVAQTENTFVLARLFLGICSAWFSTCTPLLITETAYPTHRGVASSLFNCGWYVGSIVAAWTTFGTRNYTTSFAWRIPSILQALLPLIAMPGFILIPESPRWLISAGRTEEARKVLADSHAGGDLQSPLVTFEVIEIESVLQAERDAHASTSYLDMFKTKGNRHRLFISVTLGVFGQWVGNGVVSYYLAMVLETVGITSVTNQTLISGCLQIWNMIWAVLAAFNVDRVGRRKLFLASGITMLSSYIVITGLSGSFASTGHPATGVAVIPFLFIYFAGYDIALTPLLIAYPCEIWPYRLRSRGLTVTLVSTVLAVFFNIFINPIALGAIGWKYYVVFIVVLILMIVTVWFYYPETRGKSLEQMSVLFDGEDAAGPTASETARRASVISQTVIEDKKGPMRGSVVQVEEKSF